MGFLSRPHTPSRALIYRAAVHSLQGALGKTSGRSYKAAPRQLLQVEAGNANGNTSPAMAHAHAHISREDAIRQEGEGAAKEAAKIGAAALGTADDVCSPTKVWLYSALISTHLSLNASVGWTRS